MLSENYGQYSRTLLAPVYPVKFIGIVYGKQNVADVRFILTVAVWYTILYSFLSV